MGGQAPTARATFGRRCQIVIAVALFKLLLHAARSYAPASLGTTLTPRPIVPIVRHLIRLYFRPQHLLSSAVLFACRSLPAM